VETWDAHDAATIAIFEGEFMSKHALITGASRGIGRALALRLAEQGAAVVIHYCAREDAAQQTLDDVRARGGDGFTVQADLTQPGQAERLLAETQERLERLDVFVHGAKPDAPEFYTPPLELNQQGWRASIDSQARAFLVAAQAAAPLMGQGGRIVALTYSPSTRLGSWQPWAAMGAAKAALESLVRYFAVALGPRGITVNAVSPGFVVGEAGTLDATQVNRLPAEGQQAIREWHEQGWTPMRRLGTPSDVADAVALLCDERAGFITGQVLNVDGGASVMDPLAPLPIQNG
jgi:NAD(P)-dependent dehydrogenase (short-subunit alcohol dehydrogenase family)